MSQMQIGEHTFIDRLHPRHLRAQGLHRGARAPDPPRRPDRAAEPRAVRRPRGPRDRGRGSRRRAARRPPHRRRQVPDDQRDAGARERRRPDPDGRRAVAHRRAQLGHRGAHGWRRVRHPPVRRDRRRDGRGDRLEGPLGVRGAVHHRRRGPERPREHRDRVLPAARTRHPGPAAARVAGDAAGQAGRPRPRRLRRRARGSDRAPADPAERAPRGHPTRRARAALPAEDRPGDAAHHRRRGAGPLAAPDRRAADAGGLHARGGAQRADRAAHDVGPRRGPAPAARVVRRRDRPDDGGQHLRAQPDARRLAPGHRGAAHRHVGHRARHAHPRAHRERADRCRGPGHPRAAARDGGAGGDRRLRHGALVARLPAAAPDRRDQGRPVVRHEPRDRLERRGHRPLDHRPRPQPRPDRRRRGRRGRGRARHAGRVRLRHRPGLPLQPGAGGAGAHGLAERVGGRGATG